MAITNLVHSARGSDVDMVVDGKITVKDGELQSVDQRKILADLKNTGETLMRDRLL